jgi:hypothetical protein
MAGFGFPFRVLLFAANIPLAALYDTRPLLVWAILCLTVDFFVLFLFQLCLPVESLHLNQTQLHRFLHDGVDHNWMVGASDLHKLRGTSTMSTHSTSRNLNYSLAPRDKVRRDSIVADIRRQRFGNVDNDLLRGSGGKGHRRIVLFERICRREEEMSV